MDTYLRHDSPTRSQVLVLDAMTVEVTRFPNHPMQRQVKITYADRDVVVNGENTIIKVHDIIKFQQFADSNQMLRCSKATVDVSSSTSFKFEDLHMSFQGTDIDSGDRKFRLSPTDANGEVDEDGVWFEMWESLADPDTGKLAHPTRSYSPGMPAMADSSFENYNQNLTDVEIDRWLGAELFGAELQGPRVSNFSTL